MNNKLIGRGRAICLELDNDVDDFVQTKAALSQSQKQFSQVINNILEGVVLFEMDGMVPRIQYISDNALRLYDIEEEKYQAELAAGKTPDETR